MTLETEPGIGCIYDPRQRLATVVEAIRRNGPDPGRGAANSSSTCSSNAFGAERSRRCRPRARTDAQLYTIST